MSGRVPPFDVEEARPNLRTSALNARMEGVASHTPAVLAIRDFESELCKIMKTYYRRRILTLTIASGLLMAGGHLNSNSSEILPQHPRSDLLCLTEISA